MNKNDGFVEIVGFENYSINRNGIIRAKGRVMENFGLHKYIYKNPRIMKHILNPWGYVSVRLTTNGRTYTRFVHVLLAKAFIPNPDNKPQVNHINGVKSDNRIENLEWVTSGENQKHAWDNNLRKRFTQEKHPKSKVVLDTLSGVFYNSMKELSDISGINHSTLRCQLNGTNYNSTQYILC